MIAQIASQYLLVLIEYQTSDAPALHDPTLAQYYFSSALCLLNYLTGSPGACKRIATHPAVVNDVTEKLLAPNFIGRIA